MRLNCALRQLCLTEIDVRDPLFHVIYPVGWIQNDIYSHHAMCAIILAYNAGFNIIDPTGRDITHLVDEEFTRTPPGIMNLDDA
jgi:hypothetical protein